MPLVVVPYKGFLLALDFAALIVHREPVCHIVEEHNQVDLNIAFALEDAVGVDTAVAVDIVDIHNTVD